MYLRTFPSLLVPRTKAEPVRASIDKLRKAIPGYGTFSRDFDLAQAMAVLPSMILELADQFPDLDHMKELPTPSKIPFNTLMNLPEVLSNDAMAFSTCHIEHMSSFEFLTGSWMGYYSD